MMLPERRNDLNRFRTGEFASGGIPPGPIKLLSWNIERGLRTDEIIQFIRRQGPAVCLLQEVDLNTRRTDRKDVAALLASKLNFNFVFATEWQELSQGSDESPAFQGQATMARGPIRSPRLLRFKHQTSAWEPAWWKPWFFQPRYGGRMALATEIEWGEQRLVTYNTHLESQVSEEGRRRQLREILDDAQRYGPEVPVVIAGDLNTRQRPSPVLADLRQAKFRNALGQDYVNTKRDGSGSQDWIFIRGPVRASAGQVHSEERSADHFPLSVELALIQPDPAEAYEC